MLSRFRALRLNHASRVRLSAYEGRDVSQEELTNKKPEWAIEETNFCLGRVNLNHQFREEDDLARRTLSMINSQVSKMHTRLRDGTVIPYMALYPDQVIDNPVPAHVFVESPLFKYTWDEVYDDAYDATPEHARIGSHGYSLEASSAGSKPDKQIAKH